MNALNITLPLVVLAQVFELVLGEQTAKLAAVVTCFAVGLLIADKALGLIARCAFSVACAAVNQAVK